MSPSNDASTHVQLMSNIFGDLLDSVIMDVASECHRVARLGLDRNLDNEEEELRLSTQARAMVSDPGNGGEANGKYIADIFGQQHHAVSNEIFNCMNCGRSIVAGRFAPHLEKCIGKGRKARLKSTRSSTVVQRQSRGSLGTAYASYSSSPTDPQNTNNRGANGITNISTEEYQKSVLDNETWEEQRWLLYAWKTFSPFRA